MIIVEAVEAVDVELAVAVDAVEDAVGEGDMTIAAEAVDEEDLIIAEAVDEEDLIIAEVTTIDEAVAAEGMTIDEALAVERIMIAVVEEEDMMAIDEAEKWTAAAKVDFQTTEDNRKEMALVNSTMGKKMRTHKTHNRTGMTMSVKKKMMVKLLWKTMLEMQLIPNKLNQKPMKKVVKIKKLRMNHQEKKLRKN